MFEKILFPTDFSEEARNELHCITGIPGIREIILLHVIRLSVVPRGSAMVESLAVHDAEVYLQRAKTYIAQLNPDIHVVLEEMTSADITTAILEKAEDHEVDLIVVHTNIRSIMTGVLLDHVPSKVLCRISKINVMVMPKTLVETLTGKAYEKYCPMIFSRILCPTDFSDLSLKGLAHATALKGVGEIIYLHVIDNGKEKGDPEEAVRIADRRFKALCGNLTPQGIKSRSIVLTGKPEIEIPRIAQEMDVSLIWMRSSGQGCLHDFFFGSTVHEVVMNATRPVVVIRSDQ